MFQLMKISQNGCVLKGTVLRWLADCNSAHKHHVREGTFQCMRYYC